MTLRGDPPKSDLNFKQHADGLRYAPDYVAFIRKNYSHFFLVLRDIRKCTLNPIRLEQILKILNPD